MSLRRKAEAALHHLQALDQKTLIKLKEPCCLLTEIVDMLAHANKRDVGEFRRLAYTAGRGCGMRGG